MRFLSSGQVADLLHVPVHRLAYLTRDRQLRPAKGPTGAFAWSYDEVCRAARFFQFPVPSEDEFRTIASSMNQPN